MQKFLFLTYGFEPPTPEIMEKWQAWFASLGDDIIEQAHLPRGLEISHDGKKELALGPDALTGYMIVHAEDMDAAEQMASSNPFIKSIQIYEIMSKEG